MIEIISAILGSLVLVFCGAIGAKMRNIDHQLDKKMDKDEVRELVQDKMLVTDVKIDELKSDLAGISAKLDRLIENR